MPKCFWCEKSHKRKDGYCSEKCKMEHYENLEIFY